MRETIAISRKIFAVPLALAGLVAPQTAMAQQVEDDHWLKVGAYLPDVNTQASIARPGEENFATLVDLEADLGLSDRDVLPSVTLGSRLGGNWRVQAEFYKLNRSGHKSLERDITFDGVTYPVAATLDSGFDSDVYRLSFGYSFVRKPDFELGAALGVHATNFDLFMRGVGSVGDAEASTELRQRKLLAPLPTVGLYTMYDPGSHFGIAAQADYLSLKIGDYDGKLLNLQAEAKYGITDHLRIGAMYRYVDYKVDITKERYTGRIAYKFNGPAAFVEWAF